MYKAWNDSFQFPVFRIDVSFSSTDLGLPLPKSESEPHFHGQKYGKKGKKTSVKRSIEFIKPYKIELSLNLNVVAREMFYRHFATG